MQPTISVSRLLLAQKPRDGKLRLSVAVKAQKGRRMESDSLVTQLLISWAPMSLYWLIWFIVPGAAAAYYAYQDGIKRMPLAMGVHPGWWALFCFVSGAWGILAYWVMHHSSLVKGDTSE